MNTTEKYWQLLHDFEDYITAGAVINPGVYPELPQNKMEICSVCRFPEKIASPDITGRKLVMIIGNSPGIPNGEVNSFSGKMREYLDKWLDAIKLDSIRDCYLTEIAKCTPDFDQADNIADNLFESCLKYLEKEIAAVKPAFILALGKNTAAFLTGEKKSISELNKNDLTYFGTPLLVTYHPADVLKNSELRKPVWQELQKLQTLIQQFLQQEDYSPDESDLS